MKLLLGLYDHLPSLTALYSVWSVGGTVCDCTMIQQKVSCTHIHAHTPRLDQVSPTKSASSVYASLLHSSPYHFAQARPTDALLRSIVYSLHDCLLHTILLCMFSTEGEDQ